VSTAVSAWRLALSSHHWWVVLSSFKTTKEILASPFSLPAHWGFAAQNVVTQSSPTGSQCLPAVGCAEAAIPVAEIGPAEALRREPRLHPGIQRAFAVPDASVDGWRLLWGCAEDVERRGGTILTYHEVEGLVVEGDRVCGAHVRDMRSGEAVEIRADITVSAAGAWAAGFQNERVTPRGLEAARGLGLETTVYTVNDEARIVELEQLGVSGIFTDCPDRALAARGRKRPRPRTRRASGS